MWTRRQRRAKTKQGPISKGKPHRFLSMRRGWGVYLAMGLCYALGARGGYGPPREDLFNKEGFGVTPSQVSLNFGVLLQVDCHTKLVPRWEWQDSLLGLLAEQS